MKTAEERESDFIKELEDLLIKHRAELVVTDDGKDYGQHSGVCRITMHTIFEGNDIAADFAEFNLPRYL